MSTHAANVLVVDDEEAVSRIVVRWLEEEGYACEVARDASQALLALEEDVYDVLLLDIKLPGTSGVELLARAKERAPDVAAIMITGHADDDSGRRAVELGAHGFLTKPLDRMDVIVNVAGALASRRRSQRTLSRQKDLETEVLVRTEEIRRREEEIALRLVAAAEYRDEETHSHVRRIGMFSEALARALGLGHHEAENIRVAAPMHDIGKIGIPDGILLKPAKLTAQEFEVVKTHTAIGAEMLSDTEVPLLRLGSEIALAHHEKWDGSGYPKGLRGDEIPLEARIVAVADVYDSLSRVRPYRNALDYGEVEATMRDGRGTHFDPEILDAFMDTIPNLRSIAELLTDAETAV